MVRTANLSDIKHIVALSQEWEREGSTIGEKAGDAEYYREKLNALCLVAQDNQGHYTGYLTATRARPDYAIIPEGAEVLEIDELYVRPTCRSSGVGSALVSYARKYALEHEIRYVHVFTGSRDIRRSLSFYERHGFTPWGFQAYMDLDASD